MIYLKKITVPCLIILLMSCVVKNNVQPKIQQGVYGQVTWLEGNIMPSPDEPKSTNGQPIERSICIYKVATLSETIGQAPLFSSVNSKLVKIVKTNTNGDYECELPIGVYSIFTKEPNFGYFANSFNGKGQISMVEVKKGSVVRWNINIDYKASY